MAETSRPDDQPAGPTPPARPGWSAGSTRPAGGSRPAGGTGSASNTGSHSAAARESNDAWGAVGLMMSGLIVWGGAGALAGAWLDSRWPVLVGVLVGMSSALYLVWFRYGRA